MNLIFVCLLYKILTKENVSALLIFLDVKLYVVLNLGWLWYLIWFDLWFVKSNMKVWIGSDCCKDLCKCFEIGAIFQLWTKLAILCNNADEACKTSCHRDRNGRGQEVEPCCKFACPCLQRKCMFLVLSHYSLLWLSYRMELLFRAFFL